MRANAFRLHTPLLELTATPFGHEVLHPTLGYVNPLAVIRESRFSRRWVLRNDMVEWMPPLHLSVISSTWRARTRTILPVSTSWSRCCHLVGSLHCCHSPSIFAWPVLCFIEECMAVVYVCSTSIDFVYSAGYLVGVCTGRLYGGLCWYL